MMMCIQNLVGFCQFVLEILSGNEILKSIKSRNSVKILQKMTGNNPKLDLVNDDVHTKGGSHMRPRTNFVLALHGECLHSNTYKNALIYFEKHF